MSAEPQPEKEKTQEGAETPKRDESGSQPGKRKIPPWVSRRGTLIIAAGGLIATGFLVKLGEGLFEGASGLFEKEPPTLTHQLRDPVRDFVGREEETRILLAALKARRPAAIVGGGGGGKTSSPISSASNCAASSRLTSRSTCAASTPRPPRPHKPWSRSF